MIRRILVGGTIAAVLGVSLAACGSPDTSCAASASSSSATAQTVGYTFRAPVVRPPAPVRPAPVRPAVPKYTAPKTSPQKPAPRQAPRPAPARPAPAPVPSTHNPASPFLWGMFGGWLGSEASDSSTCTER